ncbi:hypothetical protein DLAC_09489 [Tieghemostelium lacteum]|uniref:Uncharacterized protein n=1 Tax=Tieghemostelium lacteum TaxID=361077 RepID=A0A151Z6F0_TIELA|nr:hypothetical protein DLAC_09489 [Tieghemostelium lacteum]|eukprot:KYQ89541.1 hypothetical protein DLAC_09489 [Tieghemostelium lacteum]
MRYSILFLIALCVIATTLVKSQDACASENSIGFTAILASVSYSSNNGGFIQSNFVTIDYVGQRLYSSYELESDGQTYNGTNIQFGSNSTQYFIYESNGSQSCYAYNGVEIPTGLPTDFTPIGEVSLGAYKTIELLNNDTLVLWDNVNCAPMSISTQTTDGVILTNVFNYQNAFYEEFFQIPAACSTPSSNSLFKFHNKVHGSSILKKAYQVKYF